MNSCKVATVKLKLPATQSHSVRLAALESVTLVGSKALMEHLYAKDHSFKNKPCIE